MNEREIAFSLNGRPKTFRAPANELLLNLLREEAHLTGAKYGCGVGECGACTVLVDNQPFLSCLTLAVTVAGKSVTTIEGLGSKNVLDPVQDAFVEHAAFQCGFCTPGMVMAAKSLVQKNPDPTEEEIRQYMRGNICRCTGYTDIVKAIKTASEQPVT